MHKEHTDDIESQTNSPNDHNKLWGLDGLYVDESLNGLQKY